MDDAEMLNLIEHYRWRVEPLTNGGWSIASPIGCLGSYMRVLVLTRDVSLRDAIRQAIRRQAELALGD